MIPHHLFSAHLYWNRTHLTVETLHAPVEQVYNTPSYHEHVQPMQQMVCEAGGYQRAAGVISDFAHRQK
jgi:UDP:flavonoid glycosyltransferase YjiC (YdhE family)